MKGRRKRRLPSSSWSRKAVGRKIFPELLDHRRLDRNGYRLVGLGRVDDAYRVGRRRPHSSRREVANAIDVDALHGHLSSACAHFIDIEHGGNPYLFYGYDGHAIAGDHHRLEVAAAEALQLVRLVEREGSSLGHHVHDHDGAAIIEIVSPVAPPLDRIDAA